MAHSVPAEDDFSDVSDRDSIYADSLSDPDSPSDGYFGPRDHLQDTSVENREVHVDPDAKTRTSTESQASSALLIATTPTSGPDMSSHHPATSHTWVDPPAAPAVEDAGPAPPDYAAATAHRTNPADSWRRQTDGHAHQHGNHREPYVPSTTYGGADRSQPPAETTSDEHHRSSSSYGRSNPTGPGFLYGTNGSPSGVNGPFGQNGITATVSRHPPNSATSRPQESMADQAAPFNEESGLLGGKQRRSRKRRWRWCRLCCKPMYLLNILLALLIVGLIVLLSKFTRENHSHSNPDEDGEQPSLPGGDNNDGGSGVVYPAHPPSSRCKFNAYSDSVSLDFEDVENFSLAELFDSDQRFPGGINGHIWIRPAPSAQDVDVRVWVSYATSQPWQVSDLHFVKTEEGLELKFPDVVKQPDWSMDRPCMDVGIAILVHRNVSVTDLEIATANLDVVVERDDLFDDEMENSFFSVQRTDITAIRGSVQMRYWSSRETKISTNSGSVSGTFALRDLLTVDTRSGSVNIKVTPQKADPKHPKSPVFTATSLSGSLNADFRVGGDIPARDYQTRVDGKSSSIGGYYLLGSEASFTTESGSITADVLPISVRSVERSSLYTDTHSGHTRVNLLTPFGTYRKSRMTPVKSSHRSLGGSLDLVYPQEWEGSFEGESLSGSISVMGRDVRTRLREKFPGAGTTVIGRKGDGSSRLEFKTVSGSCSARLGEL